MAKAIIYMIHIASFLSSEQRNIFRCAINTAESSDSNLELYPLKCHHDLIIGLLGHLITAISHAFEGMGSPEVSHCYTVELLR